MPYFSNKFSLDCNDNIVLLTFIGKGENKNCFNPVYVLNLNLPCVPKSKTYCPKSLITINYTKFKHKLIKMEMFFFLQCIK